jgi:hypothetical protein
MQILTELYKENYIYFKSFFLLNSQIEKISENVYKQIKDKIKEKTTDLKNIIYYILRKILIDLRKSQKGILIIQNTEIILLKIKKYVKLNNFEEFETKTYMMILTICEKELKKKFRIKSLYEKEVIKVKEEYKTIMKINPNLRGNNMIDMEIKPEIENELEIKKYYFHVEPRM